MNVRRAVAVMAVVLGMATVSVVGAANASDGAGHGHDGRVVGHARIHGEAARSLSTIAGGTNHGAAATVQCQDLLSCVGPIATGLVSSLASGVPTILTTTVPSAIASVPAILNGVPQTLKTLLSKPAATKPVTITKPHQQPNPPKHTKPTTTKAAHHTQTTTPSAPPRKVTPVAPKAPAVVTPTAPTKPNSTSNPVEQVIAQVGHFAGKVATLFGWNLLALIPMAGIAFVISRRMSAARRSVSGLL